MAFTTTTLNGAVAVNATSIVVTSATGFAAGMYVRVNGEMMRVIQSYVSGTTIPILRGQDGTTTAAHPTGSNATAGLSSDFANDPAGVSLAVTNPAQPAFPIFSYSATGAITPVQGIHIINGTGALAMTLASPTKDQDGQLLLIVNGGKVAHTLTYAAGFGGNGGNSDVVTFNAAQTGAFWAVACNGFWVIPGIVAGAATVAGPGIG